MRGCAPPPGATAREHNPAGGPCRRRARSAAGTGLRPEPPPFAVPGRRCHAPSKAARSSRRSLERPRSLVRPRDDGDPSHGASARALNRQNETWRLLKAHCPWIPRKIGIRSRPWPSRAFRGGRAWWANVDCPVQRPRYQSSKPPAGWMPRHAWDRTWARAVRRTPPRDRIDCLFMHGCERAWLLAARPCSARGDTPSDPMRSGSWSPMVSRPRGLGGKFLNSQKKEGPRTTLEAFNEEKKGRVRSARSD